jgi:phosphate transporter
MNASALEDATGETYVTIKDFLQVGLLSSVVAYGIIVSLGYALMYGIGY